MQVKLALPKGRLQGHTAALLEKTGFGLADYHERSRSYRPMSNNFRHLFVKVFHEKDIAIQVAVGNYDLGICGLDWIEELLVKYPNDAVVKVHDLGYGKRHLYAVTSRFSGISSIEKLKAWPDNFGLRIVSEYPNLAESLALKLRLRRFKIFPVWGATEVYPPENADLVIVAEASEERLFEKGLVSLAEIFATSAFLIANKNSLEQKEMGGLLELLCKEKIEAKDTEEMALLGIGKQALPQPVEDAVYLALPDGHQQRPTSEFLKKTGLRIQGYGQSLSTRRPSSELDSVVIKVVRPQDMPLQVANGNFDLAITGKDWLLDHLSRFPSSPVGELLALDFGKVSIVAVVSKNFAANSVAELRGLVRAGELSSLRVASEYLNIADKYARDNHLAPYKVIPTWGASEAFLPEEADILIENTETGSTLARHNLKVIDTLFESSACLIGNKNHPQNPIREKKIGFIIEALRKGA